MFFQRIYFSLHSNNPAVCREKGPGCFQCLGNASERPFQHLANKHTVLLPSPPQEEKSQERAEIMNNQNRCCIH